MNARRAIVSLASVAALFGSTAVSADDGSSQTIRATVQAIGGLTISLELDDSSIPVGRETGAEATVTNGTGRQLVAVILTLHADEPGISIHGGRQRVIAKLEPGESRAVSWQVCPAQPGNFLLVASATTQGRHVRDGPETAESNTTLLVATGASKRCTGRED